MKEKTGIEDEMHLVGAKRAELEAARCDQSSPPGRLFSGILHPPVSPIKEDAAISCFPLDLKRQICRTKGVPPLG